MKFLTILMDLAMTMRIHLRGINTSSQSEMQRLTGRWKTGNHKSVYAFI